jgi:hypothetical protein
MTEEEYIEERLNDQIIWYSKKSQTNQKWFKRLRLLEIILLKSVLLLSVPVYKKNYHYRTVNILLEIDVSRVLKFPQ